MRVRGMNWGYRKKLWWSRNWEERGNGLVGEVSKGC